MSVPDVFHPFAAPTKPAADFLEVVRAQGCRLWDDEGRSYLDGTASLWYCAAGHGREEIIDAVNAQMRELVAYHTFGRFTNPPARRLAETLIDLAPIAGARVLFTNGGSEAVDSALKLARAGQRARGEGGRTIFLSRHHAYHGVMLGGTSVGGLPANKTPFGPLLPDTYQVPHSSLKAMHDAVAYHGPERIAAIIAEPVIGAGGVFPPVEGYLEGLRDLCDESGALLIFDEVITGFGRLGSWFGSHHYAVQPDMMTFAKAVTSGYLPLGGVVVGPRLREWVEADGEFLFTHGNTYSGHPTCCAAGLANLEILQREQLPERARRAGRRLRDGLDQLRGRDGVAEVRGEGLMQAVALEPSVPAGTVVEAMLGRGVISRAMPYANSIAFSPPLIISDDDIDELVQATSEALDEVAATV
jgi:adenosylmethionine-8-amino-7-oxononanoate aminotransferase